MNISQEQDYTNYIKLYINLYVYDTNNSNF